MTSATARVYLVDAPTKFDQPADSIQTLNKVVGFCRIANPTRLRTFLSHGVASPINVSDSLKPFGGRHDQIPRTTIPRISLHHWISEPPRGTNGRSFVFAWLGGIAFIGAFFMSLFYYIIPFLYEAQAKDAVDAAIKTFGGLNVLVNNAGYGNVCPVEDTSLADFRAPIETNLFGVIIMTKAVLPYFRERASGHVIQISSIGGRVGRTGRAAYAAAKFGIEGFSESLSKEVGPLGIRVTIGGVATWRKGPPTGDVSLTLVHVR